MIVDRKAYARGYYANIKVVNKNGNVKEYEGFPNLLTNTFFAQSNTESYCGVGSGTTPPTNSDNNLESAIGTRVLDQGGTSITSANLGSNIYEFTGEYVYKFPLGGIVGNVSELCIFGASSGSNAFSRALILDAVGDPLVIPVTIDEQLIITWNLVYTFDTTPITYNAVDVDGIPTDITIRFNNASDPTVYFSDTTNMHRITNIYRVLSNKISVGTVAAFSGMETPGADLTGTMTSAGITSAISKAFVGVDNDSTTVVMNINASTSELNTPESNFIYSVSSNSLDAGRINYSLEFDPAISKTNLQTLAIRIVTTFSRVP